MAAGDFSATRIAKKVVLMDALWGDETMRADFMAETDLAKALLAEQTAKLNLDTRKVETVQMQWLHVCATDAVTCTDDCDFTGPQAESKIQDITLTSCREKTFSVEVTEFQRRQDALTLDKLVASQLLANMAKLDEAINNAAVAALNANLGTHRYAADASWDITTDPENAEIAASEWNPTLYPHLKLAARKAKMSNPFFLSGMNLYVAHQNAMLNAGCCGDGKVTEAQTKLMRSYFDPMAIDAINSAGDFSYVIDRGVLALGHNAYYGPTPIEIAGNQKRWSVESKNLPGVRYDVFWIEKCVGSQVFHYYKIKALFDWFVRPAGCNTADTGILRFEKVA